ncbi:S8 family peptidase [Vibrio cholerae]|uniref:S8 family peptidase n=1 Tax=Vibrio cholerae TaxID=666 RepID=UPI001581D5B9|nr:S8 family peptidase [Vibrio cholerae]EIF5160949.1 S8 family peptidase [Vibrio cholerae]QKU57301.1 S8 family peptidase [Vibrio cholerae]HAS4572867.1 S8 family peptidase [Vibrio cholerae]
MSNNSIKHVKFSPIDYYEPPVHSGGSTKLHKRLTRKFIDSVIMSVRELQDELGKCILDGNLPYLPAVVELESTAISKSNRPNAIFNDSTCPFFGDVGFSRFLIKATPRGLKNLEKKILNVSGKKTLEAALSTVKAISKFEPKVHISGGKELTSYIVRLLRFEDTILNKNIDKDFEKLLKSLNVSWIKSEYSSMSIYKLDLVSEQIKEICASNVFVQCVSPTKSISFSEISNEQYQPAEILLNEPAEDYPIVGIVDTGISPNCKQLGAWISGQVNIVPNEERNHEHGTFVAGLASNAQYLNFSSAIFPSCHSKIFSIEAIGKNGGDFYEIIQTLDSVASKYPNIRVWNLSLGESKPVDLSGISEFGILLDEFQDRHNCLCVVSAGNYDEKLRSWPPLLQYDDRISSPGDSVRALTVGALAHLDGFVNSGEPSSFSRRGPVSNFVQKPEIVHFGGNLMPDGSFDNKLAIRSICPNGYSTYNIGTSFSTPLVSNLAANLFHRIGEKATPSLVKGLLVHSANLNFSTPDDQRDYLGWGVPSDIDQILNVQDYEITLVFEGIAKKSFEVQKLPFPIPQCLRTDDGKVRGEFFITLVYQPELDSRKSFEYCQIDLSVGLGKTDGKKFKSMVPLMASTPRFEKDLTKTGDKWSPIKVYQKAFPRGADIEKWKLRVALLNRDGFEATGVEVPFSIILTIRDIDKEKPVYNEMLRLMDQYNWEVADLLVDNRIKL